MLTEEKKTQIIEAVDQLNQEFGTNSYTIFAAGLLLASGDYEQLMREGLLDGHDDKKIDFCYIDRESGRAIIIQAYTRDGWKDDTPKANKASDLNAACAWLLDSDINLIARSDVRAAAEDLRDALSSGDLHEIAVYFLHNSSPSTIAQQEMRTVEDSLRNKLKQWAEQSGSQINGVARELSLHDVSDLYDQRHAAITITDEIRLPIEHNAHEAEGDNWRGLSVTVRASELVRLSEQFGDALTSANIRDYLGRRSSSRNINQQIRRTASEEPQNFWVYNNGLTLITRGFELKRSSVLCQGLAVTNGAQTLGSLTSVDSRETLNDVLLPVRIIESADPTLIENIIRYNNTQNPIRPWELRVLDRTQARIQDEFDQELGIAYQFRRSIVRTSSQDIHLSKLAPWLAAFRGEPVLAHRNSPQLFENERTYRALFNDETDIHQLLLVYRLGEAVGATKDKLRRTVQDGRATEFQSKSYGYFRYGAFVTAVIYFASEVLSESLGIQRQSKDQLRLKPDLASDRALAIAYFQRLVEFTIAPIPTSLDGSEAYSRLRSEEGIAAVRDRVLVTVAQMRAAQQDAALDALTEGVLVLP
ncbi:AIPR family protein [Candidatus Poriferisodalis sp.]|uniref:AIPR family protein n=1 Tax=Candidatus Poriferisodalis sp. TaxID=3101277 RepID=UPI003B528019